MDELDPRHGTPAGFQAGCSNPCCRTAMNRSKKRSRVRLQLDGPQIVPAHTLTARLRWWADRGIAHSAVAHAAGLSPSTLTEAMAGARDVCLKSTLDAALRVTWADLPDRSLCNAAITRARVYSMMAAGHELRWIKSEVSAGIPLSSRWTIQQRLYLGTARSIQALYERVPLSGHALATQVKARNKGHQHPLAWDDTGAPAMPHGWAVTTDVASPVDRRYVDEQVIARILDGDATVRASKAERAETCRRWVAMGRTLRSLEDLTGWRAVRHIRLSDEQAVA